jgi:predicted DCC family thiol-disulfide oxidoreductase YuxK
MERVVFFDGVCNFCSFWVKFVIRRDSKGKFKFASLQSPPGREACRVLNLPEEPPQSVILKEGDRYFTQSTASLRIMKELTGLWPLMHAFIVVPAPLRNLVYRFIAVNRYQWFGKNDSCFVPTPEIRSRFL